MIASYRIATRQTPGPYDRVRVTIFSAPGRLGNARKAFAFATHVLDAAAAVGADWLLDVEVSSDGDVSWVDLSFDASDEPQAEAAALILAERAALWLCLRRVR
jgi:hypothetical protein